MDRCAGYAVLESRNKVPEDRESIANSRGCIQLVLISKEARYRRQSTGLRAFSWGCISPGIFIGA